MELVNHTPFSAALFRGCIDDTGMIAAVVVRRSFDLVAGYFVRAAVEIWPVCPGPWPSPAGPVMAPDDLFYRGGVDLFLFGSARSSQPTSRTDVTAEVGQNFKHTVAVFGDRVWTKSGDGVVPGPAKPFTEMPLTLANAYGGTDVWDELPIPYGPNPGGKGYAISAESAVGKPLPNVELPAALIKKYSDHPEPAGVGSPPYPYGLRAAKTVTFDSRNGLMKKLDPKFFNAAFPEMVVPTAGVGDRVKITGMSPDGPIRFTVPPPDVQVRMRIADKTRTFSLPVDQIGVDVDNDRGFVTYRQCFRYTVVPLEKRSIELIPATGGAS